MEKSKRVNRPRSLATAKGEKPLPPGTDAADERLLDEAINETFPASDSHEDPERFQFPTHDDHPPNREERIRKAAYDRFMARGGQGGSDLEDWIAAEAEIDARRD